jgi:hypothetical protein
VGGAHGGGGCGRGGATDGGGSGGAGNAIVGGSESVRCAFSTDVYTRGCHWFPRLLA